MVLMFTFLSLHAAHTSQETDSAIFPLAKFLLNEENSKMYQKDTSRNSKVRTFKRLIHSFIYINNLLLWGLCLWKLGLMIISYSYITTTCIVYTSDLHRPTRQAHLKLLWWLMTADTLLFFSFNLSPVCILTGIILW